MVTVHYLHNYFAGNERVYFMFDLHAATLEDKTKVFYSFFVLFSFHWESFLSNPLLCVSARRNDLILNG